MCVHHGKVMRHRKPDEWRITCARAKGWCRSERETGPVPSAGPCQLLRLADAAISALALGPRPPLTCSPRKRNRPAADGGHLLRLAPAEHCVLVTCHLLLFSGLTTLQDRAFQSSARHKRERGEEKLTRPLFAPAQILWKSRHQEKNQIKSQQKQSSPTKSCRAPLQFPLYHSPPYKTPQAPRRW